MNQLAIDFDASALARRSDPDTSKRAAQRTSTFRSAHAAKIFAAIADAPHGLTYREAAAITGLEPVAVGRRLKELRETAGIYADGERGGCQVWRVRRA